MTNEKAKEISFITDEFGAVAVKAPGITITFSADRRTVDIVADASVTVNAPANLNAPQTATAMGAALEAYKIGETAKEGRNIGWIYAGVSEDPKSPRYNKPLWVAPKDAGVMEHDDALTLAKKQTKQGNESHVPTGIELNQIFTNLAQKDVGGFDRSGSNPAGWYWAAEHDNICAACQRFSDGNQSGNHRISRSSVRFVR